MADYSQLTWVDDSTPLSAANQNNQEAGIKDAAQNSKQRGTLASRPAAAAGNKNWLWVDSATNQLYYSDGSSWHLIRGGADSIATRSVLEVGISGQTKMGRSLVPADFTDIGLGTPAYLLNLGDANDSSGNGRNMTNKNTVTFGTGITGAATEAAHFTGVSNQALYRASEAANQIRMGTWGCWCRTPKRGTTQLPFSKWGTSGGEAAWYVSVQSSNNAAHASISLDGTAGNNLYGTTDVCDNRWHFIAATYDGSILRLYVDCVLENTLSLAGLIKDSTGPMNVGGYDADGSTNPSLPWYGAVDEAFLTTDVLNEDHLRRLAAVKIAHGAAVTPTEVTLNVRRRSRGGPLAVSDFPTQPLHLWNLTAGLTDQGSLNNTLTANNSPVACPGPDGQAAGAYSFATNQTLSCSDTGLPTTGVRSLGVWLRTVSATDSYFFGYGTSSGEGVLLMRNLSTKLQIMTWGSERVASRQVVNDGGWHFAVVTYDGSAADGIRFKLYLDGRMDNSATAAAITTVLSGASGVRIGSSTIPGDYLTGGVGCAFICDYVLTAAQIYNLYYVGSLALGASPKDEGAHVEMIDATNVYVLADQLEGQHQLDLKVRA